MPSGEGGVGEVIGVVVIGEKGVNEVIWVKEVMGERREIGICVNMCEWE